MIKYLREISDVHNEFGPLKLESTPNDKDTILILAGDIHTKYGVFVDNWINDICDRFFAVIYVLGNHDYWKSSYDLLPTKLHNLAQEKGLDNLYVLQNSSVIFQTETCKLKLIGTTLWADYNRQDPLLMFDAKSIMKDFKKIRTHQYTKKWSTFDVVAEHEKAKNFIINEVEEPFDGKIVVITHHAPSHLSCDPKFLADKFNGCYYSDLSDLILDHPQINVWFHGHIHSSSDYVLGETRVICNPRGYVGYELNTNFKTKELFDIEKI